MTNELIFDAPASRRFVEARQTAFRPILRNLKEAGELKSAADVGCGVGYFSAFLAELGFDVVGLEGRPDNVEEARRRHPKIDFRVANVEEPAILQHGSFDLVLCVGLLYHLESPLRALRHLATLTNKLLLIESYATPGKETTFHLREEQSFEDQSMTSWALYPSESSLIKLCYKMGFSSVFLLDPLPDHEDFRDGAGRKRQRTTFFAAKSSVNLPHLRRIPEPEDFSDPWQTTWGRLWGLTNRLKRSTGIRQD